MAYDVSKYFVLQQLYANEIGTLVPIRAQEGGVPREILAVIPPEPDLGENTPFLGSDRRESAFSVPVYLLYGDFLGTETPSSERESVFFVGTWFLYGLLDRECRIFVYYTTNYFISLYLL